MSMEQAVDILDRSKKFKHGTEAQTVHHLGGEPLLWSHIQPFIALLKERGIHPHLYTNMLEITPELARWLRQMDVQITGKLNIDPRKEEQLAVQAAMIGSTATVARKMIDNIRVLQDAGYDKSLFSLNNVIRRDNIAFVPGYYEWCLDSGLGPNMELMCSGGGITEDYWKIAPRPEKIAALIQELQIVREERGLPEATIAMPHIFEGCQKFRQQLYFAVNGDIYPCSADNVPVLANMEDPDAIAKAWSDPLLQMRRKLSQDVIGEPCHECDSWGECLGGCRATAESSGDSQSGYTLCPKQYL